MNASVGDFFPNKEKLNFAQRNVAIGKVIYCRSEKAKKDKRLVIIGISSNKKRIATLCFNTDKYFTKNKLLGSLELYFNSTGRDYLTHNSYLSCVNIEIIPYQVIFDRLIANPEDFLGTMDKKDLDLACTTAVNSPTAIPNQINEFGLTGYKLKVKP